MATGKEYFNYVKEQLSDIDGITFRPMMGEYIVYCNGKVIGGIYDGRFLVKKTPSSMKIIPDAPEEIPYDGAKKMLLADIDNSELMSELIPAVANDLPEPKKKK